VGDVVPQGFGTFDGAGVRALSELVFPPSYTGHNVTLHSLDLSSNALGPEGAAVLGATYAVRTGIPALCQLDLSHNRMGVPGLHALVQVRAVCPVSDGWTLCMRDVKEAHMTCVGSVLRSPCVVKRGLWTYESESLFSQYQTYQLYVRVMVLGALGFCLLGLKPTAPA